MTPDQFWRSTLRTIYAVIKGYVRRRGFVLHQAALLARVPGDKFPELWELTGEAPPRLDTDAANASTYAALKAWASVSRAAEQSKIVNQN